MNRNYSANIRIVSRLECSFCCTENYVDDRFVACRVSRCHRSCCVTIDNAVKFSALAFCSGVKKPFVGKLLRDAAADAAVVTLTVRCYCFCQCDDFIVARNDDLVMYMCLINDPGVLL